MSILSTLLIFVLVPLAVAVVIAGLALAGGSSRRARRYRPGRPYDFTPIWFLASPEQVDPTPGGRALTGHGAREQGHALAIESGVVETGARAPLGATGGASDRW